MKKTTTRPTRKVFSYYFAFARSNGVFAILAYSLFACAFACTEILRPYIVKYVIDGTLTHTITPLGAMAVFGAAALLYNIFFRGADYTIIAFESRMFKVLYDKSIGNLLRHSPLFFVNQGESGKLITKIRRYVTSFEVLFEEFTFRVSIMAIYAVGVTTLAILTDWRIGLLLVLFIVLFSATCIFFFNRKMELEEFAAEKESAVSGGLSDIILNVQAIKQCGQSESELEIFGKKSFEYSEAFKRAEIFGNHVRILKGTLVMVFDTLMVGLLCYLYNRHLITIGTMYLFFSYSFQISMAIWSLDEGLKKITKSIADAGEMTEIFDHPIELSNPTDTVIALQDASVTLENISFSYGGTKQVFNNLSLVIPSGQKIGICGVTGSGKTTLANLILRTMDPAEGTILVDNYSIKNDFSQDGLKQHISYVPQKIDIFNRTIIENIRFGSPLATDEEVVSAARRAQLHDFILTLPNGYQTLVGENGSKLSGGQQQRVGIARAIVRNKPILILDEATAALDVMTEGEILDMLDKEFDGKTVIVIAHRLSTIRDLDRILVLEDGRIVEDGTHHQLMDLQGSYFGFIQTQNTERRPSGDLKERSLAH